MYRQPNLMILKIYIALNVSLLLWERKLPSSLPIFLTFIPSELKTKQIIPMPPNKDSPNSDDFLPGMCA